MTGLVDFHCHLDLYSDHSAAVAECEAAGVRTLAVTTTPKAWTRNRDLAARTSHVRAALGLHPQLVAERAAELTLWERYLPETSYVGEVGLDAGPRFIESLDIQKAVFQRVLRSCAQRSGKILSVHSTRAAGAVLDLIEAHLPPERGTVVLHWFTGSKSEAWRAVALGCYFSVNAEMMLSERRRDLAAALPLERLLTESDGPFAKVDGRPARPGDVRNAVEALARVRRLDSATVASAILANLQRLISTGAE